MARIIPRQLLLAAVVATACTLTAWPQAQEPVRRGALTGANGGTVTSAELRSLIDTYIPVTLRQDMILVFSQCFGSNWFGDFLNEIGVDVTMLAASVNDKEAAYGGVHVAYAEQLKPGNKVQKMADEGVKRITGAASGDTVATAGTLDRVIGGTESTHVVVWASQPNDQDWVDINTVKANFAGNPNTSVIVLAGGADIKDKDGNVTSLAATKDNLKLALAMVGYMMTLAQVSGGLPCSEQFIFHVADHGDVAVEKETPAGQLTGPGPTEQDLAKMDPEERKRYEEFIKAQKEKQRPAAITMQTPPEEGDDQAELEAKLAAIERIEIGPVTVWDSTNPADTLSVTPLYLPLDVDVNGDDQITWDDGLIFDGFDVRFDPETPILDVIDPLGATPLRVFYNNPVPLAYDSLALHIGPVPRTVPEPGAFCIFALVLAVLPRRRSHDG